MLIYHDLSLSRTVGNRFNRYTNACEHNNDISNNIRWNTRQYATWLLVLSLAVLIIFVSGCGKRSRKALDSAPKNPPSHAHLLKVPDAKPKIEPLSRYGNRFKNNSNSYVAKRKRYRVMSTSKGYRARGLASWYGTYFHGKKTSSGEKYNMYQMTAAHPTLPLPTYARVTNLENGKSVIVKVNDRGPFHSNRLIDVSYVAAAKLGMLGRGTGKVEVISIDPRDHGGKLPKGMHIAANGKAMHGGATNAKYLSQADDFYSEAEAVKPGKMGKPGKPGKPGKALKVGKMGKKPEDTQKITPKQNIYLQLGTYPHRAKAEAMAKKLEKISKLPSQITQNGQGRSSKYQVRIGPVNNDDEAISLTQKLARARLPTPTVITESLSSP